jgi:hypothetical protein
MFESVIRAVLAHKQAVIAAIAITGVLMYAIPTTLLPYSQYAAGQRFINREITVPCLPYCNVANRPTSIDRDIDDLVHIHIHFSFVPVGTRG